MSRAMLAANAAKQRAAASYLMTARPPASKYLAQTQQAQVRGYYCGPATVAEMLAQLGVKVSQNAAARQLGTDGSGTDWSNNKGYPVARVLDANEAKNNYVAVGLPWTPNNAQVKTYENDLVTDLNRGGSGVPLAGNAYEVPGGPHLVGHPAGQEIMHWFDIRGYSKDGAVTAYEDSVHGASSIAWSGSVPAYSTLPSATIVYILGARGYIW
ncbi:MAG TPA: C39 family peptidase [Streptosporangiaceae bacterium]|nr:C39 family peptidase [Streptosporangiaceae bacterium]